MISRTHLSMPNAYKLCVFIEMSTEIGMLKFLGCDPGLFACAMVHETHFSVGNITFYVKGRGLSWIFDLCGNK